VPNTPEDEPVPVADLSELAETVRAALVQAAEMRDLVEKAKELRERAETFTPHPYALEPE
jgi:hypothetical protein